jgi:hypothetical protein
VAAVRPERERARVVVGECAVITCRVVWLWCSFSAVRGRRLGGFVVSGNLSMNGMIVRLEFFAS